MRIVWAIQRSIVARGNIGEMCAALVLLALGGYIFESIDMEMQGNHSYFSICQFG